MVSFIEAICSARAAAVSLLSAFGGTILEIIPDSIKINVLIPFNVDIGLQRLAWTIAIIAGMVAIINGSKDWFKKCPEKVKEDKEDETNRDN